MLEFISGLLVGTGISGVAGAALMVKLRKSPRRLVYMLANPPSEIHVENVFLPQVYESLLGYLKNNDPWLMLITPNEYEFCKSKHKLQTTRDEFADLLREKYAPFKGRKVGLHTHFAARQSIDTLSLERQIDEVERGKRFLEEMEFEIDRLAPGNWAWNEDTLRACRENGIENFHLDANDRNNALVRSFEDVELVTVYNYIHDTEAK